MFSKAKVTMVNVWATTCSPCIQEMPHIQQLANNYAGRGLKVVTVLGDSEIPGCINSALVTIGGIQGFNLPVLRNNSSVDIPMSQMLTKVSTANGRTVFAKLEIYGNKFIRNDLGGHLFKDGSVLPRHFNAGIIDKASNMIQNGLHFWY